MGERGVNVMVIKTLLIANRGEIAARIMRTAKSMGIKTVAIFSDADTGAPYVKCADVAMNIGAAPPAQSYLNIEAILEAARRARADAIHPGYGFLSENAEFARAVEAAGFIFIGPTPSAIEVMGDKARAKRAMIEAGVACIPGYEGDDQSEERFEAAAAEIGFPVMIKAAAGGGGRGMRVVNDAKSLKNAVSLARSEAENAFGSGALILEKAVHDARHVEIQIFADAHGATVHLGERDCSVQRRHQKIIEEAPCPVMTPALRADMGASAIAAAKAVDYRGAGTVEFLLDGDGNFYFLEMNTRLQVEHPVTELVTGLDLVELQIRVAMGERLDLAQSDVTLQGHAVEARLYTEDPSADFAPSTGEVALWRAPSGEGVRCDAGVETGFQISPYYDAMAAKVIAWGENRDAALMRLCAALEDVTLFGPSTNQAFLREALTSADFIAGRATTGFVEASWGRDGYQSDQPTTADLCAAAVLFFLSARDQARVATLDMPDELLNWSSVQPVPAIITFGERTFHVIAKSAQDYSVAEGGVATKVGILSVEASKAHFNIDGAPHAYVHHRVGEAALFLQRGADIFRLENLAASRKSVDGSDGDGVVAAPMHGNLVEICVEAGDNVKAGDRLAVLEAMKMQHQIVAEVAGRIDAVLAEPGGQVAAGAVILTIAMEREDA